MKKVLFVASLLACAGVAHSAVLTEGFDVVANLPAAGWKLSNQSVSPPVGQTWRQGSSASNSIGPAQSGAPTAYALVNYTDTSSTSGTDGTISDWMVTPALAFNGATHTVSFWTRTGTGATFPDRLEVRLSTTTQDTGTTPTSVGAFTTLLLSINPTLLAGPANYPDVWTNFTVNIPGASVPGSGYVAFRYFVTAGGVNGANSNIIGVDTLSISAVPEPTGLAAIAALPMLALASRRRR